MNSEKNDETLLAAFHHFFDEMTKIGERSIFGYLVDSSIKILRWRIGGRDVCAWKNRCSWTNRGFGLIYIGLSNGLRSWSNQIGTVGCAITIQELRPLELDRGRFVLLAYLDGRGKTKLMKLYRFTDCLRNSPFIFSEDCHSSNIVTRYMIRDSKNLGQKFNVNK